MKKKKAIAAILNILSVFLILISAGVTVMIFATNNNYSEPVFGDTMLLSVREDSVTDGAGVGSLALVDLTYRTDGGGYFATYFGSGTRITKDPMGCIGTVKGYVPLLGGVIVFFRDPVGFFLTVVLPLTAMVIWYIIKVILIVKEGGVRERSGRS
jgi:hypothetical protein